MQNIEHLKVGDKVLMRYTWNDAATPAIIEGETKTSWRISGKLYKKANGHPKVLDTWAVNYAYIELYNEEVYQKALIASKKRRLEKLFSETRWQDLSLEALEEVLTVLKKHRETGIDGKSISNSPTA